MPRSHSPNAVVPVALQLGKEPSALSVWSEQLHHGLEVDFVLGAARILAGLDQSELARLVRIHVTTIVRREGFDAQKVRGQSGTIAAVVNALLRVGVELGDNGSVIPKPKAR
jgi:hypothetical protein